MIAFQVLQINGENVAGYSESKVNDIIKKAGVNNIVLAVRDRLASFNVFDFKMFIFCV